MKAILVSLMLAMASPLAAQSPAPPDATPAATAAAQKDDAGGQEKPGVRFVIEDHPSLRVGKVLRVDFRVKLHGDFRGFSPARTEDLFAVSRRRLGIEGTFLRQFEYQLEREFRVKNDDTPIRHPWRDVFVNFRYFDNVQIRSGKFKMPFGLEELNGEMNLDFVYRSRVSNNLSPARDIGVTAHGQFFTRGLGYEAGVFKQDGENSRFGENPGAGRTVAGRMTMKPLRLIGAPKSVRELEVGVNAT